MAISIVGTPVNQNITLGDWNGTYFIKNIQINVIPIVSNIVIILTGNAIPNNGVYWDNTGFTNRINQNDGNVGNICIYDIDSPLPGTFNISVRDTHTYTYNITIIQLTGVSTLNPRGAFSSTVSFSSTASHSISTEIGQFIIGGLSSTVSATSSGGQTDIVSNMLAGGEYASVAYKQSSSTSSSLTWTLSNERWAVGLISYNPLRLGSIQEFLNNRVKNIQYFIKTGTGSTNRERVSWTASGLPAAGVVNTTTIGGITCNSSTTGALYYTNPSAGKEKKIFNINLHCDAPSYYLLIDRLWECSVTTSGTIFDITSSTSQTINSVTWPARDINGSTNGEGIYIAAVSNGGWSSGVVDININYTNSSGLSGRSGVNTTTFTGNPTNGTVSFISLDTGDTGVRSIQSLTLAFGSPIPTTGTFHLIAVRPICLYVQEQIVNTFKADFLSHPLPKLQNDSCLTFITQGRAGSTWTQPFSGYIEYSEA